MPCWQRSRSSTFSGRRTGGGLAHDLYQLLLPLIPTVRITVNTTACSTQYDIQYRTTVLQCATTCFSNYWPSSDEQSQDITEGTVAFTLLVIFTVNRDQIHKDTNPVSCVLYYVGFIAIKNSERTSQRSPSDFHQPSFRCYLCSKNIHNTRFPKNLYHMRGLGTTLSVRAIGGTTLVRLHCGRHSEGSSCG
jgi:hypothetical protein